MINPEGKKHRDHPTTQNSKTQEGLVRQALRAEKDVFVEKPLCLFTAEGKKLIRLRLKKNDLRAKGTEAGCYYPAAVHVQECVRLIGHRKGDFPKR
jgi:predicted dehydrogenase